MSSTDPFDSLGGHAAHNLGQTPRFPVPPAYAALCDNAKLKGQRVLLYAANGAIVEMAVTEGGRRVASAPMGTPRPLSIEQAARTLSR